MKIILYSRSALFALEAPPVVPGLNVAMANDKRNGAGAASSQEQPHRAWSCAGNAKPPAEQLFASVQS